jgi:hypothetical protein
MIRNRYPLPLIPDLISQVRNAQIFTKFNVREGYNNVLIKEGDQHKGSIQNEIWTMGTISHVFRTNQFTSHIPGNDGLYPRTNH